MRCPYVQIYEKKTGLFEKSQFCRCTSRLNPSVKNGDGTGYVEWKRCVKGDGPGQTGTLTYDSFVKCPYYTKYN